MEPEGSFKRVLGAGHLTLLSIGGVVGAGIFVMTGNIAALYAGPGVAISFILAGVAAMLSALCYAELSAAIPNAGSAYTYTYWAFGRLAGWLVGWCLILEYLLSASSVAAGWSAYLSAFIEMLSGQTIPAAYANAPFIVSADGSIRLSGAVVNGPAVALILGVTSLLYVGVREAAWVNAGMVVVKLVTIGLVLLFCAPLVDVKLWHPIVPRNTGPFGAFGWSGIVRGASVAFFSYVGFDGITALSQETRNPRRDLPVALLLSLAICTVLYVATSLVMTGVVPYTQLAVADPIYVVARHAASSPGWLAPLVDVGAVFALGSVVLATLVGLPRICHAMAEQGLLPACFARLHRRFGTPHVTTVVVGVAAAAIAGLFPLDFLGELVSMGTLLAFAAVGASVIRLRTTCPDLPRSFRVPWNPWIPALGVLACVGLMACLPRGTGIRVLIWLIFGVAIYVSGTRRRQHPAKIGTAQ